MIIKYEELLTPEDFKTFTRSMLLDLIALASFLAQKYTKSKVRKTLPSSIYYSEGTISFNNSCLYLIAGFFFSIIISHFV